jgi:hypothetical protein
MADKIVFVLGAGFTKAFIKEAILLTDPYPINHLLSKFSKEQSPYAYMILKLEEERARLSDGRFDLERLMTRLDSNMPHDFEKKVIQQLDYLRHDLFADFVKRLEDVNPQRNLPPELKQFARWCIDHQADCITFNYDDFFDEALWDVRKEWNELTAGLYWHPNSGYGFFCPPAEALVQGNTLSMGRSSTLLLKLHGSINWRTKRGAIDPYQLDTVLHYDKWSIHPSLAADADIVERHIESKRFIVLPVLMKSDLTDQPTFRLLWDEAYKKLESATHVIFIGYSMPLTDIPAGFLFGEAIRPSTKIDVVNLSKKKEQKEIQKLISNYQSVMPQLTAEMFDFDGAVPWLKQNDFIKQSEHAPKGGPH